MTKLRMKAHYTILQRIGLILVDSLNKASAKTIMKANSFFQLLTM